MKDIINVAVVAFKPVWGDKEKNLNRIAGYAECAARRGANLIVFPETALSGYDTDHEHTGEEQMHRRLAEPVPGPATQRLAEVAKENDIYIVFGLPERGEDGNVYNSAAVVGPEGIIGSYRKIHLGGSEAEWAERGSEPLMFDTPWGKIGVAICYDTFVFSEIMRYYAANGCRLHVNPCAVDSCITAANMKEAIEYLSATNAIFIASANCAGHYKENSFVGATNIIGPGRNIPKSHYYAGAAPGTPGTEEFDMHLATLDLTYVNQSWLRMQWDEENPHFRPDVYIKMYEKIAALPRYHKNEEKEQAQ